MTLVVSKLLCLFLYDVKKRRCYPAGRITSHVKSTSASTDKIITDLFVVFCRHHFIPDPESRVALVAQVIGVRVSAGRVVFYE